MFEPCATYHFQEKAWANKQAHSQTGNCIYYIDETAIKNGQNFVFGELEMHNFSPLFTLNL